MRNCTHDRRVLGQALRSLFSTFVMIFVGMLFSTFAFAQQSDTLWSEDWEGNWSIDWHITFGTWGVDSITSGPGSAYSGQYCAATNPHGNYGNYVDSTRLIRHTPFTVPTNNPRLRFWHWYYFQINDNDWGKVQIRASGTQQWEDLPEGYFWDRSGGWTQAYIDLSAYVGQMVEIAFLFHSDNGYNQPGWYIDDLTVESGVRVFNDPEDWESGFDDWYVDYGFWQVGTPTSGPGSSYQGQNCVGTILDGNYWNYVDGTRLISPPVQIPSNNPRLRFWHWYYFQINDTDWGKVQIRISGTQQWEDLPAGYFWDRSGGWTRAYIDLSAYVGQMVEIAFLFHSDNGYYQAGWYIDELTIESGVRVFNSPEDWESGFDDWYVDYGFWQVGTPTSGPGSAYQGQNCVGTILDGNYLNYVDSTRLISPPVQIPFNNPRLRFFHWYYFQINDNDWGDVQVKVVGSNSGWQTLPGAHYTDQSNGWFEPYLPLTAYADSVIQIAFLFHSDNGYTQAGWYIDSLTIIPGPTAIKDKETTLPLEYKLDQNYPNPFNPSTTIRYQLPKSGNVKLTIYNMLSQQVRTLVNEQQPIGDYQVQWDGRNDHDVPVTSGLYFYQIITENYVETRKMLLLR